MKVKMELEICLKALGSNSAATWSWAFSFNLIWSPGLED